MNPLPQRSPRLCRLFTAYARWYVWRHFHAVRVSRRGKVPELLDDQPLVVVMNHPSWWDPLIGLLINHHLGGRTAYAPIDAAALERYRFFGRLGFFGVAQHSPRGARAFLETGATILREPGTALWITAQGRFTDARERPVQLRPGLGHLARRVGRLQVLPVAVEYTYWQERLPEVLIRCGAPVIYRPAEAPAAFTGRVADQLAQAMDALATESRTRDERLFTTVAWGRVGVGGIYELWQRLVSRWRGQKYNPAHATVIRRAH